jgi:hypothetical protein
MKRRVWPLVAALLAFALLGVLWIVSDRRASERVYDRYSTANTSDDGLSLAYAYLAKQRKVGTLTRAFGRQPLERNATVFRLTDALDRLPTPRVLNDAEEMFVRSGGRIVLCVTDGALPSDVVEAKTATKVFPIWPGLDGFELYTHSGGYTSLYPRMHALFVGGTQVILARERIGSGELYLLSTPESMRNEYLPKNLALLEALAGEGRPVYFDEFIHGIVSDDGALALMKDWNLGPFLLLLALAAALTFWRAGKRIGHADDDYRETRSDAVDLVRSLGALYQDVTSVDQSLALYHDSLTRTVAHTSGLRGDALHKRVEELTGGRRTLDGINEGFSKIESQSLRVSKSQRKQRAEPSATLRLCDQSRRT